MYIKEIVLDGFKSYGQRTVISGFDTEFNAITGLNGTGKSNILDSICFVLGISNLSQVRAGSLQDLIFKSGQAGINKATVSITFDNRNKSQCPPGFEEYDEISVTRQVVMGGKNKYLLNGSIVQNKRIQDFFCSVQLNVNNPHFLIMQGRITKVLNMKPQEILAMVEEAAGTRMYETKRQAAQKTIEKKESKLLELEKINQEEIAPKLNKLREERTAYLEYQRIERELEHLMTLFQAWQYLASQRRCEGAEKALEQGQIVVKELEEKINRNEKQAAQIENEVTEAAKKLETEGGDKLRDIEKELKDREKSDAKADATEKSMQETVLTEEKKIKQLQKNFKDDDNALKKKEQELEKVQGLFEQLKEADAKDNQAFALSQKKYEAISVGMEVNDDGEAQTLQDQLMSAKQLATEANTDIKQSTMQLNHLQTQLKEKQKDLGSNAADYQKDQKALESMEKEVQSLQKSLSKMSYSEEKMNDVKAHRQNLLKDVRTLQEKIDRFQSHYPYTNFRYRDPETNFNRSSVKGLVCRLIKVKDSNNCTALETVAGGRLYNVIVDTDSTSKKLLQRGNLQNRTTFIPLNKIQGGKIDQNTINFAQKLVGKENVQPALSLIEYDKRLQPAIEYVFGNTFVCRDLDVARQVTFHDKIMRRCVTLEGDVIDPSGTLSGGARQKSAPVLLQLNEIEEHETRLKSIEKELVAIESEIKQMSGTQNQWLTMRQQCELKQHEVGLIKKRLQQTTHHLQLEEIDNMKKTIVELTDKIQRCKEIETENTKKIKDLQFKMKDSKGHRERLLKEAEDEMKKLKKKADSSRKNWQQREQEYETLTLEISELKKSLENIQKQITLTEENLVKLKQELEDFKTEGVERKEALKGLQIQYKAEKVAITEKNKELQKMTQKKEQLLAQVQEYHLEIKQQDHEIKKLQEDHKVSKQRVTEFSKKEYDSKHIKDAQELGDAQAADLEKRIRNLQEKRTKLSRTVNSKAQSMFEHEEKQYNQLLKKKAIVESDKRKLLHIMKDLDKKKVDAIMLAWKQVSEDFGSIFRTLLPGSNAKLQAPQGHTVLDGLEVKVFLGGVWKESLSELSGGQRSLVALSLILAMLLFKPAPLYILDEVDAALDLSHTQNIGNMLKSHFKQSQFIVVSLKDGMFNNANVLFRTKFVDGVSAVTRTVNRR